MIARIDEARERGDTIGGVFEVVAPGSRSGSGRTSTGIAGSMPGSRPR